MIAHLKCDVDDTNCRLAWDCNGNADTCAGIVNDGQHAGMTLFHLELSMADPPQTRYSGPPDSTPDGGYSAPPGYWSWITKQDGGKGEYYLKIPDDAGPRYLLPSLPDDYKAGDVIVLVMPKDTRASSAPADDGKPFYNSAGTPDSDTHEISSMDPPQGTQAFFFCSPVCSVVKVKWADSGGAHTKSEPWADYWHDLHGFSGYVPPPPTMPSPGEYFPSEVPYQPSPVTGYSVWDNTNQLLGTSYTKDQIDKMNAFYRDVKRLDAAVDAINSAIDHDTDEVRDLVKARDILMHREPAK